MPAADIFKGILALGAGAAKGYVEKKQSDQSQDFKRQLKDMELQVRMENYARLHAEAGERQATNDLNAQTLAGFRGIQGNAINTLLQPKVENLQARTELTGAQTEHIPVAEKLAQMLGDSLIDYRKDSAANQAAAIEERRHYHDDHQRLMELWFGTAENPGGIKIGPDGKVLHGGDSAMTATKNLKDFPEVEDLINLAGSSRSRIKGHVQEYIPEIRRHPEKAEKLIQAAMAYDENLSRASGLERIWNSDAMRKAIAAQKIIDAQEAKTTKPSLPPDASRMQQMILGNP